MRNNRAKRQRLFFVFLEDRSLVKTDLLEGFQSKTASVVCYFYLLPSATADLRCRLYISWNNLPWNVYTKNTSKLRRSRRQPISLHKHRAFNNHDRLLTETHPVDITSSASFRTTPTLARPRITDSAFKKAYIKNCKKGLGTYINRITELVLDVKPVDPTYADTEGLQHSAQTGRFPHTPQCFQHRGPGIVIWNK